MTEKPVNTIAPLKNVTLFAGLVDLLQNRPMHLSGMGCFHGFSGYGKTQAAIYGANRSMAYYVEMGDSWVRSTLCDAILTELGITPRGTVANRVGTIIKALSDDPSRPLIIDEADFLVRKGMIDMAREIHERSQAPVILIGEETLPSALIKHERAHNRILEWVPAVPCDLEDARYLAKLYAPKFDIADDLLTQIVEQSHGRARRICVNINRVVEQAKIAGTMTIGLAEWGDRKFFTGKPPMRRPDTTGRRSA